MTCSDISTVKFFKLLGAVRRIEGDQCSPFNKIKARSSKRKNDAAYRCNNVSPPIGAVPQTSVEGFVMARGFRGVNGSPCMQSFSSWSPYPEQIYGLTVAIRYIVPLGLLLVTRRSCFLGASGEHGTLSTGLITVWKTG